MKKFRMMAFVIALGGVSQLALAQQHDHDHEPKLHVNPRWSECSFQLDPALTQEAWHEFTREAGLVAYFRPLTDAKPMGAGNFEISLLQWQTAFDDAKPAWNDTFVHPDSAHWLKESSRLAFPGLTARVGITRRLDAAIYITKNPQANYGFYAGQIQYNILSYQRWSAAARASYASLFGPDDLKLSIYGIDALVSREFKLYSNWLSISPYAGVSTYLTSSRETTESVDLHNEQVVGGQAMVGTVLKVSVARIGVEYNFAKLSTLSIKVGVAF
jgi:hypothetical protein